MRRLLMVVTCCALAAGAALLAPGLAAGQETPPAGDPVASSEITAAGEPAPAGTDETVPVDGAAGLVGVTWDGDPGATFRIEVSEGDGTAVEPVAIEAPDGGPDDGTAEANGTAVRARAASVSEPVAVSDPTQVRVVVTGGAPEHVSLVSVAAADPPAPVPSPAEASLAGGAVALGLGAGVALWRNRGRLRRHGVVVTVVTLAGTLALAGCVGSGSSSQQYPPGQPPIRTRAQWGADESLRCTQPDYADGVRYALVHHTVNENGYTADESNSLVRNIYTYHTRVNGWCDIGYNFLIDRFGTIFEGRAGGLDRAVIGAHALNFNTNATGVAIIGDLTSVTTSSATRSSLIELLVWKLSAHAVDPYTPISKNGVVFDPISGHRDVNQTSCPGDSFYPSLGSIRSAVRPRVFFGDPRGNLEVLQRSGSGVRAAGWAVDPEAFTYPTAIRVTRLEGDQVLGTFYADIARSDISRLYGPRYGSRHGFDGTVPMSGSGNVCVTAIDIGAGSDRVLGCARL